MNTQKQKSTTEQKNHSRSEFFYNKISNMKVGLTRAERKLNAKQKSSKKKWTFIFIGIALLALFGVFAVANNFINSDYYAHLTNTLVSKMYVSIEPTGFIGGALGNVAGGVAMAVVLGLEMFAVKFAVTIFIVPICSIIDSLTMIVLYFVQGGLLRVFLDLMFVDESNSLQNALIFIVLISVGIFAMAVIVSSIKTIINDEATFSEVGASIITTGVNTTLFFVIPLFLYFFTSLVATHLIAAASGTAGAHYHLSFSKIILIFSQKNNGILGGGAEKMLSYMPGDISDYFKYDTQEVNGVIVGGYDISATIPGSEDVWFSGGATDYYYDGLSGEAFFQSFDKFDDDFLDESELVLYDEVMYGSDGLYIRWINDATRSLGHNLNIVLFIVAIGISGVVLFIMTMQLFLRAFQITGLMLIGPYAISLTPWDGGEKFSEWKKNIFNKFMQLMLFVVLYVMYITLLLEFNEFYNDWMLHFEGVNGDGIIGGTIMQFSASLFSLICVVGGAWAVIALPAEFAGIVGGLTALVGARMMGGAIKTGVGVATSGASNTLSMMKKTASNVDQRMGGLGEKVANQGGASSSGPTKNNLRAMVQKQAMADKLAGDHNKSAAASGLGSLSKLQKHRRSTLDSPKVQKQLRQQRPYVQPKNKSSIKAAKK